MSNSDAETLMQVKHSTPSKVRFPDKAGPSTAPAVRATTSTPNTNTTTVTSPSTDDLYTDAFNFALPKIFSSTLMASLNTKDAILKEIRDCILTENEDRCNNRRTYFLEEHACQEWMCVNLRQDSCTKLDQRSLRGGNSRNTPRQLGNDRYGDTCMVAIHASVHNIKNSKVQSLCQNR